MHNAIPTSRSYFFSSASRTTQAAMCTTLRAAIKLRNWLHIVGNAAAVNANSTSMHRHSASIPQSPPVVADQAHIHAFDVIVGRVFKALVRQIGSRIEQGVAGFFAHAGIVRGIVAEFHRMFPVVVFVHSQTLCADKE